MLTLASQAFVPLAQADAKALGVPDLPLVVIPHPYGSLPKDQALAVADRAAAEVLARLTLEERVPVRREARP